MSVSATRTFGRALKRFAVAVADQTEADYAAFAQAADVQRIAVKAGFLAPVRRASLLSDT